MASGQGQRSNQTPRVGGQDNNGQRVNGMQYTGMTYNTSPQTYLLFRPDPTGVRPPRSDITQYQDHIDRARNNPHASSRPTNHRPDNTRNLAPNPPPARYWACCQNNCEERGGSNSAGFYTICPLCGHHRCIYCPAGNDWSVAPARQPDNSRQ